MKTPVSILAALVAGALLASPALAQKTVLTVGMQSSDAGVLDPHLNSGTPGKAMLQWMFNGLVRIKPGELSPEFIEPDLAESWTSSADGKEWTFKLRHGVQCHHGYGEFTSEDAVYSLKRASAKETSAFSSDYSAVQSIEAPDKYTVKITLKQPIPSLLGIVMNYHGGNMVCKKAAEELGKEGFAKKPIGTGPFMFSEYVPQQYAKLVANPDYFRGKPKLTEILYRFIPSDSSRDLAFQAGELDMMLGRQEQAWVDRMKALPGVKVVAMGPAEMSVLHLNESQPPLDNLKVRQAIAYAIDRNAIVSSLLAQDAVPLKGIYLPGEIGYEASFEGVPYDPEKAKALLAEAGFANGVTIDLHFNQDGTVMEPYVAQAVQAQLAKVGITANLDGAAQSIMIQKYGAGDSTGMSLANYAPIYADSSFLVSRAYFASKSRYGGYLEADDKQLDEMGAAANLTTDAAFRQKTYAEIEKHVIVDKAYWVPLYQLVDSYGVSKKIDWNPRPDQNFDFGTASVR